MADQALTLKASYNDKPIEILDQLIAKRAKALMETTERATIATAINVFTSLKAGTEKAPLKGDKSMYTIERTGLVSSWERVGSQPGKHVYNHGKRTYQRGTKGKLRRVVREGGKDGPINRTITGMCRNLAGQKYVKGESVHVYKMQLKNENCNETVYYAHAISERQARDYIEKVILGRLLAKEAGMAKYAIGIAQARVSNRPMTADRPSGSRQMQLAYRAAQIDTSAEGFGTGKFYIHFYDALKYSALALKGGPGYLQTAMMKAANRTAGMIHVAFVNKRFDEDVQTPFPEVQRKR